MLLFCLRIAEVSWRLLIEQWRGVSPWGSVGFVASVRRRRRVTRMGSPLLIGPAIPSRIGLLKKANKKREGKLGKREGKRKVKEKEREREPLGDT